MPTQSTHSEPIANGLVFWILGVAGTIFISFGMYWVKYTTDSLQAYELRQINTNERVSRLESYLEYSEKRLDRIESKIDKLIDQSKR